MSTAIATIALVVSIGVAAFNAYFQFIRGARITLAVGDFVSIHYARDGKVKLGCNLTLFNDGARYAAVTRIVGHITPVGDEVAEANPTTISWRSFVKSLDIGEPGREFKPYFAFAGWAR